MFSSILLLFFLPWIDKSPVRSGTYRPLFKRFFWLLVIDVLVLGWVGGSPVKPLTVAVGQIAAAYYFLHFLVILPWSPGLKLRCRYRCQSPNPCSTVAKQRSRRRRRRSGARKAQPRQPSRGQADRWSVSLVFSSGWSLPASC